MKRKTNRWLWLCIAVSLLDFGLVLAAKISNDVSWKEFPQSIMESAQMVTLDASYDELFDGSKKLVGQGFDWSYFVFSILAVATPVLWGGVVLNFFFGFFDSLRYKFGRRRKPCYFFSELHENSLELAKSLSLKNKGKCLCLFFGVGDGVGAELREEAKSEGFILKKDSEIFFLRNPKSLRREQHYFEISRDQDENISHARKLVESYSKKYGDADWRFLKIFVFSEQKETPLAISSIDKKGIPVQIIDRNRFFACDLFFRKPLYSALSGDEKTISLLILGGTEIAKSLFKTALWCGQLGSACKLKVALMDESADFVESQLRLECPKIFAGNYDTAFINAGAKTAGLVEALDSKCSDANYICVCFDDDELNIETALRLRSYRTKPIIAVCVKDRTKNELLPEFSVVAKERRNRQNFDVAAERRFGYNLVPFGGDNQLYSCSLIDSELEKLAFNVHYAYEVAFDSSVSESKVRKQYWENEVNLRSDRANALHIRYKLFALGYDIVPFELASPAQVEESGRLLLELKEKLLKAVDSDNPWLAVLEHDRWSAFMESEGWRPLSLEQARLCGSHKDVRAKLHACLCPWDSLDAFKEYDPNFKEYDKRLVRDIPVLLGLAAGVENISRVKYALVKNPLC